MHILSRQSEPLKQRPSSSLLRGLFAPLLAAALAGAQPHAGFQSQNLDLSGSGLDLKTEQGVGGLGFLSDGRLAVLTWGGNKGDTPNRGKLFLLSGVLEGEGIQAEEIAGELSDPLGLAVVDDALYVSHKKGILKFQPDGGSTSLATVAFSGNYHEYHFSVVHKDGYLYSSLGQPYSPRTSQDRGGFLKTSLADGSTELIAGGLREPNGGAVGPEGALFVTDNQGHWLPTSKMVHVEHGDNFGFKNDAGPFQKSAAEQKPPVVWFTHGEVAKSPMQPILVPSGQYAGQMLVGDHRYCNLMRVFIEKVQGTWQGAVFLVWDSDQMLSGANRLLWGPDGALYMGGMGQVPGWGSDCGETFGIQKLTLTEGREFEILAMRSAADGFELEFTQPHGPSGLEAGSYTLRRWGYKPGGGYGSGNEEDSRDVAIQGVEAGTRPNSVTLVVDEGDLRHGDGLIASTTFALDAQGVRSQGGEGLRRAKAWYTLNEVGPGETPVALERRRGIDLHLSADSRALYLRGSGVLRARIRTLDGRLLRELRATGPSVVDLGPLPGGIHFVTGTLDGAPFTKTVVAAN